MELRTSRNAQLRRSDLRRQYPIRKEKGNLRLLVWSLRSGPDQRIPYMPIRREKRRRAVFVEDLQALHAQVIQSIPLPSRFKHGKGLHEEIFSAFGKLLYSAKRRIQRLGEEVVWGSVHGELPVEEVDFFLGA